MPDETFTSGTLWGFINAPQGVTVYPTGEWVQIGTLTSTLTSTTATVTVTINDTWADWGWRWANTNLTNLCSNLCSTHTAPDEVHRRGAAHEALLERRRAEARRARLERECHNAAINRARQLFRSLLSPTERDRFDRERHVIIRASDGRAYRIECDNDYAGNVSALDDDGSPVASYCAHPEMVLRLEDGSRAYLPMADAWIAQMLQIQTRVEDFLAVANRTDYD